MYGDWGFSDVLNSEQEKAYEQFLYDLPRNCKLAIVEIGAGIHVPTIRNLSENLSHTFLQSRIIRINPRDHQVPRNRNHISLSLGGLDALQRIENELLLY